MSSVFLVSRENQPKVLRLAMELSQIIIQLIGVFSSIIYLLSISPNQESIKSENCRQLTAGTTDVSIYLLLLQAINFVNIKHHRRRENFEFIQRQMPLMWKKKAENKTEKIKTRTCASACMSIAEQNMLIRGKLNQY
jgi:hypothetical protein